MNPCDIHIPAEQCEHADIKLRSSGHRGGDSGHGAGADLIITQDCGAIEITKLERGVRIWVGGDWEVTGLLTGLVKLGDRIAVANNMTRHSRDKEIAAAQYKRTGLPPFEVADAWPLEQRIGYYRGGALKYLMQMDTTDKDPKETEIGLHHLEKLIETLRGEPLPKSRPRPARPEDVSDAKP